MVKTHPRRKRFRAALALAGMTQQSFAEKEGVHPNHLWMVLDGRRESRRLIERIDEFTDKHLPANATSAA